MTPDVSRLSFDAKEHVYTLDGTKKLTGVTTVIDGTSSKSALIQWAANEAVKYIKDSLPELPEGVASTGLKISRSELFALLEEARTAHTRKRDKAASTGTDAHALVETYINNSLETGGLPSRALFDKAIEPFATWAQANVDRFIASEQRLYSEKNTFAGTCDFVAIIGGKLTVGDLKTFPKMWSPDAFVQMGAYSLMWRELTGSRPEQSVVVKMCDPKDPRIVKYGGKPFATYPRYALEEDEGMFLKRLDVYRYNQNFVSPTE